MKSFIISSLTLSLTILYSAQAYSDSTKYDRASCSTTGDPESFICCKTSGEYQEAWQGQTKYNNDNCASYTNGFAENSCTVDSPVLTGFTDHNFTYGPPLNPTYCTFQVN